jgi:diguanylate cyclase (GGDEF)-like protein
MSEPGLIDRAVLREALTLVQADQGALVRHHDGTLSVAQESSPGLMVRDSLSEGFLDRVVSTGQPVLQVSATEPSLRQLPVAMVAVPLVVSGTVDSVLLLLRDPSHPFTAQERDALVALAPLVGATIRTARITEVQRNADPLTGAANRRQLDSDLSMLIRDNLSHPLSLLMLDLDNFKIVNDVYGHPVGDAVLQHVVEVIRDNLRPGDRLFRYGGEEFCVVLPTATPIAASAVAGRICQGVERTPYCISADRPLRVTVSVGVATASGDKPADLIARADSALYHAKSSGRNRVVTS